MKVAIYLVTISLLIAGLGHADSIRIKGVLHKDVYIKKSDSFYYVHFPTEGRVEKINRIRKDVSELSIDTDVEKRKALWETYQAHIEKQEQTLPEKEERVTTTVNVEKHQLTKELEDLLLFETQLMHWKELSQEEREFVQMELNASHGEYAALRRQNGSAISGRLGAINKERTEEVKELGGALNKYERAVRNAEERRVDSAIADYLRGARTSTESREKKAAAEEFIEDAEAGLEKLELMEKGIQRQERDLLSNEQKAYNAGKRYGARQDRIDVLVEADRGGYQPRLELKRVSLWNSEATERTQAFSIDTDLWLLDCKQQGLAENVQGFSIKVFDAKTKTPFTQIADVDFLHMRSLVLKGPGEFYLEVERGRDVLCRIEVLTPVQ